MLYRDLSDDAHSRLILIGRTLEQWLLEDARERPDRSSTLSTGEIDAALDRFLKDGVHDFRTLVAAAAERLRSNRAAA